MYLMEMIAVSDTLLTSVLLLPVVLGLNTQCRHSEFQCSNEKCVPLNRFCDAVNDCGDSSDEPRFCTRKFHSPVTNLV